MDCEGLPGYITCRYCGLPVAEGQCKSGCPTYVEWIDEGRLTDFLKGVEVPTARVEIIGRDRENRIGVMVEYPFVKRRKEVWTLRTEFADAELLKAAISVSLLEFLYRDECGNVARTVERYGEPTGELRSFSLWLSEVVIEKLKEMSGHYGIPASRIVNSHARWLKEVMF